MPKRFGRALLVLVAGSIGMFGGPTAWAEEPPPSATVTHARGDFSCAGDTATLTWTPPSDRSGVIGYRITRFTTTPSIPSTGTTDVGPDQTSLSFGVPFGITSFRIFDITASGVTSDAFAQVSFVGSSAPQAMEWDSSSPQSGVGDSSAIVPFRWYGTNEFLKQGLLSTTVRVTASPGGATALGPVASFIGLTNGVAYTFSAVTFNSCGARSSSVPSTPTFVPGVAPSWTRSTPPLTAAPGEYVYKFAAQGDPAPGYRLLDAPAWLGISPEGRVHGRPPTGTQSFSYSVVARNGVGLHPVFLFPSSDAVAGPFTVSMRSAESPQPPPGL